METEMDGTKVREAVWSVTEAEDSLIPAEPAQHLHVITIKEEMKMF